MGDEKVNLSLIIIIIPQQLRIFLVRVFQKHLLNKNIVIGIFIFFEFSFFTLICFLLLKCFGS
jgi:hypothetical protein